MTATASAPKPKFAQLDELACLLHATVHELSIHGEIELPRGKPSYAGLSAKLCAAYRYLAERDPYAAVLAGHGAVKLMRHKEEGAELSRWWLQTAKGEILDLEYEPGERRRKFPYELGKPGSVRVDGDGLPRMNEARKIIARAQRELPKWL